MYYVARLYSGSGDRAIEELNNLAISELLPKLKEDGGLIRYATFAMDDGRLGSGSVYKDKESAQRGLQIAKEWAANTTALQNYTLDATYEGEVGLRIEGDVTGQRPEVGAARVFETKSTAVEIGNAILKQYKVNEANNDKVTGRTGTYIVQLGPGKVGIFIGYVSEAARQAHFDHITKVRSDPSTQISKMMQSDPEVMTSMILSSNAVGTF